MKATRGMVGGPRHFSRKAWAMGAVGMLAAGAGCADGETSTGGGGNGGESSASSSGSGGAGGSGMGGSGGSGGAGMGGAGGSGMGGAGGAGGAGSDSLYPLKPGATWTYNVTSVAGGAMCDAGTHETVIVSTPMLGGRQAFEVDSFCTGIQQTSFLSNVNASDQVDIYEGAAWALFLPSPMKDGQMWMTSSASYTWYFADKVTVPAGTFSDCWKAQQNFIEGESYTIYCRGVGPVRAYLAGGIVGSGFDAQLTKASFLP